MGSLRVSRLRLVVGRPLLAILAAPGVAAQAAPDPAAALELAIATAESRLGAGDLEAAERHYREALFRGWLLAGTLDRIEGRVAPAQEALRKASTFAAEDPALAFTLATDYLWQKNVDDAERIFAEMLKQRPTAATHVLIGHAYRDAGEYTRARAELRAALDLDPRVRRAHYYLGTVILADPGTGPDRLERAIAEFQEELKLAPGDPLAADQLGAALLEAGRPAEALRAFETAARGEERALHVYHVGRAQLALDRPAEAVVSTRRALELAREQGAGEADMEKIHYQLGLALRKLGAKQDAAVHFVEAKRIAVRWTAPVREVSRLTEAERVDLTRRVRSAVARAYLNLGVMQAQGERFAQAAELFEKAAEVDADFPQVQYSLGVARFNARQFDRATDPLARALAAKPGDPGLKRMLAMAWLNSQGYAKAAELLRDDPERGTDPSLELAYGLALARSGRAAQAKAVFNGLRARHGDSEEVREALRELEAARH